MAKRIREKAAKIEQNKDRRPVAYAKHIRISPSKVRLVADLVRGKGYNEAVAILENTPNGSAIAILKAIKSAAANAENNLSMNRDDLYVAEIYACPGPILKRINIRARGRVDRISKRTSHITVRLDDKTAPANEGIEKITTKTKAKATVAKTETKPAAKATTKAAATKTTAKAETKVETEAKKPAAKPAAKAATAKTTSAKATATKTTETKAAPKAAAKPVAKTTTKKK